MSWYELWLFLHVTAVITWVGGAGTIQAFGVLTKRAADPGKTFFFVRNVAWTVTRVFLPASLLAFVSGVGLVETSFWSWDEPFVVIGLVLWAGVSIVSAGFLARAMGTPPPKWRGRSRAPRSRDESATSSGPHAGCWRHCSSSSS